MEILQEKIKKTEIMENGIVRILKELFIKQDGEIKKTDWRCVCIPSEEGKSKLREHLPEQQAENIIASFWTEDVLVKYEEV